MYRKFSQLSFVIGLFFFIVSVILFGTVLVSSSTNITLYTAVVFLVFGIAMMFVKNKNAD
jgi:uncharacterized membrane protein YhhN